MVIWLRQGCCLNNACTGGCAVVGDGAGMVGSLFLVYFLFGSCLLYMTKCIDNDKMT